MKNCQSSAITDEGFIELAQELIEAGVVWGIVNRPAHFPDQEALVDS